MTEFKDYALIDVEFDMAHWRLTSDNINKCSEEEGWNDDEGIVCVVATSDEEDYECVVIADDVLKGNLLKLIDVAMELDDKAIFDFVDAYYATKCEILNKENDNKERQRLEDRESVGYILCERLGTNKNTYNYNLGIPALCRVKWYGGLVFVWEISADGSIIEPIEESLFEEVLAATLCK